MKQVYGAALAAAASVVSCAAIDVLQADFVDVLLPEVGHVFGVTSAHHTTLEEMNLRAEDVYILPKAPKLEDCLSALVGRPMTEQIKPFSNSLATLDVKPYQAAQIKIAEARAAELAASVAPLVAFAPTNKSYRAASFESIEIAPGQYQSYLYAIIQAIVYALLVPGALFAVKNGRSTKHVKKTLFGTSFFVYYSAAIIVLQNVFSMRSLFALPLALAAGLLTMPHALRSFDSIEKLGRLRECCPHLKGLEQEPLGYLACLKMYSMVNANLSYHFLSSFLPFRYGLAGIVTSNPMIAGALYIAYLAVVANMINARIREDPDARKAQARVVSFDCAFVAVAGFSFLLNLIAVYCGVGDFVAFDPPVFFTAMRTFELNLGTLIMTIALFCTWGVGYHEQGQLDEAGHNVTSMSSVALRSSEEARSALHQTLDEVRARGFNA